MTMPKSSIGKQYLKELEEAHHLEAITNLSTYTLSVHEENVLKKGLSFVPVYKKEPHDYVTSTNAFLKKLETSAFFSRPGQIARDKFARDKFWIKNKHWEAPTPQLPEYRQLRDEMLEYSHATNSLTDTIEDNMLPEENAALNQLLYNKEITIKPADKGGSIVIMDTKNYIKTALEHLEDTTIYKRMNRDETKDIATLIDTYLSHLLYSYQLDFDIVEKLRPDTQPRTPLFYYLPKIHKQGNPARPIISGCNSPQDRMSEFMTKILTPISKEQRSYLRDSMQLLQIIDQLPNLDDDQFLVTADIKSMYTNIPHDEGIQTALEAISQYHEVTPPYTPKPAIIEKMMEFILERNTFQFLNNYYLQIQGCAMGTKMAPSYANIFMTKLEEQLTHTWDSRMQLWKRYLDDIFFIFRGQLHHLQQFEREANELHHTIKFEFEESKKQVNFLDLCIYKDTNGKLQTTIYRKPCNKNLLLHYKSDHPIQLKNSIIYSQAIRLKRIISEPKVLERELILLRKIFLARGFPKHIIDHQFRKIAFIQRSTLLQDKTKKQRIGPIYKLPGTDIRQKYIKQKINTTWMHAQENPKLRTFWKKKPTFAGTSGRKLRDLLVHSNQLKHTPRHLIQSATPTAGPTSHDSL